MFHSQNKVPLGAILQQAGLVTAEQVEYALKQQQQAYQNLKLGEILAIEGKISSKTADFFAERWSTVRQEKPRLPIGQYLKQAALLNERQIQEILNEQKQTPQKFGELAIAKGWLKQTTVDFILRDLLFVPANKRDQYNLETVTTNKTYLLDPDLANKPDFSRSSTQSFATTKADFSNKEFDLTKLDNDDALSHSSNQQLEYSQKVHEGFLNIKRKLLKIEGQKNYSERTLERVLFWTGGQSFLTQKLFTLISQNSQILNSPQEEQQINDLVQNKILKNWSDDELKLHFVTIKNRLLNNQDYQANELLLLYQKILTSVVDADESKIQQELLNMGLVVRQQNRLTVANRIYKSVFNLGWVTQALNEYLPEQDSAIAPIIPKAKTSNRFKLKNLLLLLAAIGLISIFINNIAKRLTVRLAFQKGNELLKQKSFAPAVAQYNQLLNIDSNYFQAWTNRGYALAGLKKYGEMRESCTTATIIDPKAVYAWNCQGEALHNLERYVEAITAFERAIALNPDDPIFLINKSESLRALGQSEASIDVIKQAIQVLEKIEVAQGRDRVRGEFAVALTFLGHGYRQNQQYSDAIAAYQQAIDYDSNYFPANIGLGIAITKTENYQQAQAEFERILENPQLTDVQQAQIWFHLGKVKCSSGEPASGVTALEKAIELKPDYSAAQMAQKQCL